MTGLKTSPEDKTQPFWLDEHAGKQWLLPTKEVAPHGISYYFEALELTDEKLVLALWIKLPKEARQRHLLTYEYEARQ